ncbi:MAG: nitroreductase family protein [Alistipes sp.]|nr:nitroreductase family protein [Alistipes sp.]
MEFKELMNKRRSIRKYETQPIPTEVVDRLLEVTLSAPSSRNSHSTHLMVIDHPELIEKMAQMRDYGSSFMKSAPLAILVMGDDTVTDKWQINAAISATTLQLACVDEGLGSCWVHVDGSPCLKDEPEGKKADAFLREFLPIPEGYKVLCAIAIGYTTFSPAPIPEWDREAHIHRL